MKNILKRTALVASVIGLLTALLVLINKLVFVHAQMSSDQSKDFKSYYYQWKFGRVYYQRVGKGTPLLLIHSTIPGSSTYEYNKIIKTLSKSHTVYAMDLLGFGQSDKPKMTYTAYLYVQLIHDFIHNVIKEPVDLITSGNTNSFSAMSTIQYGDMVRKLIWINPGSLYHLGINPSKKDAFIKYVLELPIFGTNLYIHLVSTYNLKRLFKKKYLSSKSNANKHMVKEFYSSAHSGNGANRYIYASNLCHYTNVNIKTAVSNLNHSVYLILGDDYYLDYEHIVDGYKSINAAIETSVIHNTKAFPHLEKPQSVLEILSLYLS